MKYSALVPGDVLVDAAGHNFFVALSVLPSSSGNFSVSIEWLYAVSAMSLEADVVCDWISGGQEIAPSLIMIKKD